MGWALYLQLNATKKEIVDTEALIERYRNEIEDLKRKLEDKEKEAPTRTRRLSAREVSRAFAQPFFIVLTDIGQQIDESKAMKDLDNRIKQLTKLILTSQTVEESSRPGSPVKIDFDMSPYQVRSCPEEFVSRIRVSGTVHNVFLFFSYNRSSSPPVARSNLKSSRSSLWKTRSVIDRSSRPMLQRARKTS